MPMIATTVISSVSVKPSRYFFMVRARYEKATHDL
jgi:hypothetical protein